MGAETGIEWTDSTWNPHYGCRRVSTGCANCYAEAVVNDRMRGDFRTVRRASESTLTAPLHWRTGRRIFTCSLSDFFIEEADEWRALLWSIIRQTPQHTYQILTKRPERIRKSLPPDWGGGWPHVWLGVSGETVVHAISRGVTLQGVPAAHRFLSAEPWLEEDLPMDEPVNLRYVTMVRLFDWVILGGESGPHCRPFGYVTARLVRDACAQEKVPFFLKQLGGVGNKHSHDQAVLDGRLHKELPSR